jgi:protein TonB
MAVQLLNDMPDAAVHRGDVGLSLSDWNPRATRPVAHGNRPAFIAITIGLHLVAALGFLSVRQITRTEQPLPPIVASIIEAPNAEEAPPMTPPPMSDLQYVLPAPEQVYIETESIAAPQIMSNAISPPSPQVVVPPMVESVEYVRAPAPQYPRESNRRRESGTVILRVLVGPTGHPVQIQVERSSGFERLDHAARHAVEKALFRPHEVNGVAQAAQVLIPIEFTRRAS